MASNQIPYVIPLSSTKPRILTLVPNDPGSRYKCRQLQVQVVGKSKMIKTVLANILDVSKDMQIPPTYLGNFFGYEIGAKSAFDEKKAEKQQAYITGEQDVKDLSRLTEQFINQVLLCPNCGLPEIKIQPQQNEIYGQCRACGANTPLPIANDKFKKYVINHPPTYEKGALFAKGQGATKKGKKGKKGEGEEEGDGTEEQPAETTETTTTTVTADGEEKKEKKEKKAKKDKKAKDDDDDDVVWYTDTSEEAARKRREALLPASALQKLAEGNSHKPSSPLTDIIGDVEKLKAYKTEHNLADDAWVKTLFDAMFFEKEIKEELPKHKDVLIKFTRTKVGQLSLVGCLENYAVNLGDQMKKQFPVILKQFYDSDVLAEQILFQWHEKECKNESVKAAAEPFVKWLKEAEEEDDDEDN